MSLRIDFSQVVQAVVKQTVPVLLLAALPIAAEAATFDKVYVFGDSLSDTGNSLAITSAIKNAIPGFPLVPSPTVGYVDGRFTNGNNWIDVLTAQLGLPEPTISQVSTSDPLGVNFAITSATSGTDNTFPLPLPGYIGVTEQVAQFLGSNSVDADALYIIWAGANDYIGNGVTNPGIPVQNLANAIQTLYSAGARNFLVPNLPALGATPSISRLGLVDPNIPNFFNFLTAGHNFLLDQSLDQLQLLPDIYLQPLDVATLFNNAIAEPSQFGFLNVTDSCLNLLAGTVCDNPDQYLFWDGLHPTAKAHALVGNLAFETLESHPKPIPESSSALALLTVAVGLGIHATHKKKRQTINPDQKLVTREEIGSLA